MEALIARAQAGNQQAQADLIMQLEPVIRDRAAHWIVAGHELEDLVSEGYLTCLQAIQDYNAGQGATLATFARAALTNRFTNLKRTTEAACRDYRQTDSLYTKQDGEDQLSVDLPAPGNLEADVINRLSIQETLDAADQMITDPVDRRVWQGLLAEETDVEIAAAVGITPRSVGYRRHAIRRRLLTVMEDQ